ncbi:MAG TPA: MotA/TolQ/ExbB proton channel family protein [Pseudomonadota bacterium]|nr:MotA/TolQ/ExbB proton channel family protein [Pseudomonadota bacterium]
MPTLPLLPTLPSAMLPSLLGSPTPGKEMDLFQLVLSSGGVVLFVLFLLIAFFVVTTFVIGFKAYQLQRASRETDAFLDAFFANKRLEELHEHSRKLHRSPVAAMFRAGFLELKRLNKRGRGDSKVDSGDEAEGERGALEGGDEGGLENIERALRRSAIAEQTVLEGLTPLLATVGSSAPFVGLFGTVWGIMDAFRNIGAKGSANLATVAPGIAEALIATAIGLVAAIPAVMAYNYFARKIKVLTNEMDTFHNDFLNLVKRSYLR